METSRSQVRFPWIGLGVCLLFAVVWVNLALRHNNLERQGIDIINHVRVVQQMTVPDGTGPQWLGWFAEYPHSSHRLAWLLLPSTEDDPIRALRCAALIALLVMLLAKWTLLRSILQPGLAVLVLVFWQLLCVKARVADANHFLWEGQYNYARAVGTAALMLLLVSLALPSFSGRVQWLQEVLRVGLASYALACHAAPGAIAFLTLGAFYLFELRETKSWNTVLKLLFAVAAGGLVARFTNSLTMMKYVGDDGWMPVAWQPLLYSMYIPTFLVLVGVGVKQLVRPRPGVWSSGLGRTLLAGMLASGLMQAHLSIGQLRGTCSPYSAKSTLFITFAMTWLVWTYVAVLAYERWGGRLADLLNHRISVRVFRCAGAAAIVVGLFWMLRTDAKRPYFGSDRDPAHVREVLQGYQGQLPRCCYFDPDQQFGSYFAASVTLDPFSASYALRTKQIPIPDPNISYPTLEQLDTVLLPVGVDPRKTLGIDVKAQPFGPFAKCDLVEYRRQVKLASGSIVSATGER